MSAKYWIARYVEDVFRNEPKNVGVIVSVGRNLAARFVGEQDNDTLDGRKLKGFSHPNVYTQWHDYWRREIATGDLSRVIAATTSNYFIVAGGEVSDIGNDSAADVCRFLFDILVSAGGPSEAYQWVDENVEEQEFSAEIVDVLQQQDLLANDNDILVRHPVRRNAPVPGQHVQHSPSFSQRNGVLSVFEYIDLGRPQQKLIRERSGWMAYMFSDIKAVERNANTYSLIRPGDGGDAIEYARSVLRGESTVVNWVNPVERGRFLEERRRIADAL
jgi:hypothetical protein